MLMAVNEPYALMVQPDDILISPREVDEHFGTMVCFHPRYALGDHHNYMDKDDFLREMYLDTVGHDEAGMKRYERIGISHHPRRKPNGITKADREARKSEDLLKRDFHAEEPLTKCVTDMTEIKGCDGKLYVSAIFDCFDSSVIGLATYNAKSRTQQYEAADL